MSVYTVTVRKIDAEGRWEQWVSTVEGADRVHALVKYLRRRGNAEYLLLDDQRFRFSVEEAA